MRLLRAISLLVSSSFSVAAFAEEPPRAAPSDCFATTLAAAAGAARRQDLEHLSALAGSPPCLDLAESWQSSYLAGLVSYRLAETLLETTGEGVDDALDDVLEHLSRALASEPGCAACQALLASAYGSKIAVRPIRGMRLGRKASRHMKAARELNDHAAVVTLLDGIDKYFTPRMFGGGLDRSRKLLADALVRFEAQPEQLGWNLADAHYWYARALLKGGEETAAAEHLRLALKLEPEFAAAKAMLASDPD